MKKRITALILAAAMVLGAAPLAAAEKPKLTPIYLGEWARPSYYGDGWMADAMAEQILDEIGARSISGDRERIMACYDWLIKNGSRDESDRSRTYIDTKAIGLRQGGLTADWRAALDRGEIALRLNAWGNDYNSNTYIAAFATQMAVYRAGNCAHFSALLAMLLMHLGYETYLIDGDFINSNGSRVMHKWNMVFVDGVACWLDVRMDHAAYKGGDVPHTYFMKTDDGEWAKRHVWDRANTDAIKARHAEGLHDYYYLGEDLSESRAPLWSASSAWAEEYLKDAQQIRLIPEILYGKDMRQPITREEFAAVAVALCEGMVGLEAAEAETNPFTDASGSDVLKACNLGIINGVTPTSFAPSGLLTREQGAAMMGRAYEAILEGYEQIGFAAGTPITTEGSVPFADDGLISDYARSHVYFLNAYKIVDGVGGNRFDPKGNITREAALKIAVVMYGVLD